MLLSDLPTPQVLVDLARAQRNIARVQALADGAGARLRPHAKTHKSPIVAGWQLERGAAGVCCAKIGEAEVFAAAGIGDIRLPYPVNPSNAARLLAGMERASISIIVDHLEVARGWSEAMTRAGRTLDVLVKVDVGFHRCGIDPAANPLASPPAAQASRSTRCRSARRRRCGTAPASPASPSCAPAITSTSIAPRSRSARPRSPTARSPCWRPWCRRRRQTG
jgi:D-serine deaminase-like pyridoxal phosphate-dependent protein